MSVEYELKYITYAFSPFGAILFISVPSQPFQQQHQLLPLEPHRSKHF